MCGAILNKYNIVQVNYRDYKSIILKDDFIM